jgi:hypothetical protein
MHFDAFLRRFMALMVQGAANTEFDNQQRHFGALGIMKVFADMQVPITRAEADELVFEVDTSDYGYITLEAWWVVLYCCALSMHYESFFHPSALLCSLIGRYDSMTWVFEATEEDLAGRQDEVIDASLFNIDAGGEVCGNPSFTLNYYHYSESFSHWPA